MYMYGIRHIHSVGGGVHYFHEKRDLLVCNVKEKNHEAGATTVTLTLIMLGTGLARMSGLQCFNMGHNGHGINLYGVSMTLMGN